MVKIHNTRKNTFRVIKNILQSPFSFVAYLIEVLASQPRFFFKVLINDLANGLAIDRIEFMNGNVTIGFFG